MKHSGNRVRLAFFGLLSVLFVGWLQQSGVPTLFELRDAWRREAALARDIEEIEAENQRLASEIDELIDNGDALERIAREKLHLAREGEIVVLVPNKK